MPHRLINAFGESRWCIHHEHLPRLAASVTGPQTAKVGRVPKVQGGIAVISIDGPMTPKGGWSSVSINSIGRVFDSAMSSSEIGGIILDIDSPGGTYTGTPELSEKIKAARGVKPVVSVVGTMMASGATWAGSAADQVIVSKSASAGSVGVYSVHVDHSKMMEEAGIGVTFISSGKYKVEGHPYEPPSEEFLQHEQAAVDSIHDEFVAALSSNYGIDKATIRSDFGQGRMLPAAKAVEVGMAHGIDTIAGVISRMSSTARKGGRRTDAELSRMIAGESPQMTTAQMRLERRRKERIEEN